MLASCTTPTTATGLVATTLVAKCSFIRIIHFFDALSGLTGFFVCRKRSLVVFHSLEYLDPTNSAARSKPLVASFFVICVIYVLIIRNRAGHLPYSQI